MGRLWLVAASIIATVGFVLSTVGGLSDSIAVRFGPNGEPVLWATREEYRALLVLMLTLMPLAVVWLTAYLPRRLDGRGLIPDCEFWFASERREATELFLLQHAVRLAVFVAAIGVAFHILIIQANATSPPSMSVGRLMTLLTMVFLGLAWWFVALIRHFQRP